MRTDAFEIEIDLSRTPAIVYFEARMKSLLEIFIVLFLLLLIPTCSGDGAMEAVAPAVLQATPMKPCFTRIS